MCRPSSPETAINLHPRQHGGEEKDDYEHRTCPKRLAMKKIEGRAEKMRTLLLLSVEASHFVDAICVAVVSGLSCCRRRPLANQLYKPSPSSRTASTKEKRIAVAGDRTRLTGGNTHHYTTMI
jgi:hypothetical protein